MKILYFSTVNWRWIKQRPHFICEYMAEEKIQVTYFSITPLFKQKITKRKVSKYLSINDRFVLPYASRYKLIKYINKKYVQNIINDRFDVIVFTHPDQWGYLPKLHSEHTKIVYECMDNMPYFYSDELKEQVKKQEKNICKNVNHIITSSNYLKEKIINEYNIMENKITVIKNAMDKSILEENKTNISLNRPNLVYVGTVSEWLDIALILKYAEEHPNYSIYLIGPIDKKIKMKLECGYKNIILIGPVEHSMVKSYILAGDIMLIPFLVNDLIRGVDPIKIYEYLALNKYVVTSYWRELEDYRTNPLVNFYSNYGEFEKIVEQIITIKKMDNIQYEECTSENVWERRVDDYIRILDKL